MKKTALAAFLFFALAAPLTAQKAIIFSNFANHLWGNRDDLSAGLRLKNGNYLVVTSERWHYHRPLFFDTNDEFSSTKVVSFGRRVNLGVLHFYEKNPERKWVFYDHFFLQGGYQWHETTTTSDFGLFGGGTSTTTTSHKLWCTGIGVENAYVRKWRKWFFGPAIINGYAVYWRNGHPIAVLGNVPRFNKGMYIFLPMVRFVGGYRF